MSANRSSRLTGMYLLGESFPTLDCRANYEPWFSNEKLLCPLRLSHCSNPSLRKRIDSEIYVGVIAMISYSANVGAFPPDVGLLLMS